MAHIDLTTHVGKILTLTSPFWIASSHHSESVSALREWTELEPAAITLKTCTLMDRAEAQPKRTIRQRTQAILPRYGRGYYSDGPKIKELKSYKEVAELLTHAKTILKNTRVGVSVLSTEHEDFGELIRLCSDADFWELNLKYSMRSHQSGESFFSTINSNWTDTLGKIDQFLAAFSTLPVFIKLPRELEWLPRTQQATDLLDKLKSHGNAGLIVANSRKMDVSPFIDEDAGEEKILMGGVITGDPLFDSTLKMIEGMAEDCKSRHIPIVATGGMVDEQQVLMAMRAGADAVQLCTAFDYNGRIFYQTLIDALRARIKWRGVKGPNKMEGYVSGLRSESIASVFSMPFLYFRAFWSDAFQKQIKQDIRFSKRMDFVLMSGRTVFSRWNNLLTERVTRRFYSVRALALNPKSPAFPVIQQTWGIADPNEQKVRGDRVHSAKLWLDNLFKDGIIALAGQLKKEHAECTNDNRPALSEGLLTLVNNVSKNVNEAESRELSRELLLLIKRENEQRKRDDLERLPCPEWGSMLYDKVPFYSMYIFDDKAYVSLYPFMRPGKLASPVYVYSRSSGEYGRLVDEFEMLWNYSTQTDAQISVPTVSEESLDSLDEVEY